MSLPEESLFCAGIAQNRKQELHLHSTNKIFLTNFLYAIVEDRLIKLIK